MAAREAEKSQGVKRGRVARDAVYVNEYGLEEPVLEEREVVAERGVLVGNADAMEEGVDGEEVVGWVRKFQLAGEKMCQAECEADRLDGLKLLSFGVWGMEGKVATAELVLWEHLCKQLLMGDRLKDKLKEEFLTELMGKCSGKGVLGEKCKCIVEAMYGYWVEEEDEMKDVVIDLISEIPGVGLEVRGWDGVMVRIGS